MLTLHNYRQCIIGSLIFCCTPSDEFGCSFKMSDIDSVVHAMKRDICLKMVNITDDSALYYTTLSMILWTWCKIWEWHDRLSLVWFSKPLFIFCIIVLYCVPEQFQLRPFWMCANIEMNLTFALFSLKKSIEHVKKTEKIKWSTKWFD